MTTVGTGTMEDPIIIPETDSEATTMTWPTYEGELLEQFGSYVPSDKREMVPHFCDTIPTHDLRYQLKDHTHPQPTECCSLAVLPLDSSHDHDIEALHHYHYGEEDEEVDPSLWYSARLIQVRNFIERLYHVGGGELAVYIFSFLPMYMNGLIFSHYHVSPVDPLMNWAPHYVRLHAIKSRGYFFLHHWSIRHLKLQKGFRATSMALSTRLRSMFERCRDRSQDNLGSLVHAQSGLCDPELYYARHVCQHHDYINTVFDAYWFLYRRYNEWGIPVGRFVGNVKDLAISLWFSTMCTFHDKRTSSRVLGWMMAYNIVWRRMYEMPDFNSLPNMPCPVRLSDEFGLARCGRHKLEMFGRITMKLTGYQRHWMFDAPIPFDNEPH